MIFPHAPSVRGRALVFVALLSSLGSEALAQADFLLTDLDVSPRLTDMSGGDFAVETTTFGEELLEATGGDFTLEATVTPLSVTLVADDVTVFLVVEGENLVLTWPASGDGYVLESAAAQSDAPDWQPVQPSTTEHRFVTPLAQPARFFRLRRP